VYFKRRDEVRAGVYDARRAPGVYSERVQRGGNRHVAPVQQPIPAQQPVPAQQGYVQGQQGAYGTM